MMKAIVVKRSGDSHVLHYENVQLPLLGDDDVLVRVKAIGINFIDIYIRNGFYPTTYPYIPGKEASGVVESVGKHVHDIQPGSRVAFCFSGSGTYAEYVCIPANQVVLLPPEISFTQAAASLLQGLTAIYLTHLTYPLQKNEVALIHAGSGGVGSLLIQLAKHLKATVITTVSTREKAQLAHDLGADHVINYLETSFLTETMAITDQQGVNVVYDAVGRTTFDDSLQCLTVRGMLVSYGQASGPVPSFDLLRLADKSLFITRPKLQSYTPNKEELNKLAQQLFQLIIKDKLKVIVGQTYSLEEAAQAQEDLETRKTVGKSLLLVD